MRWGVVMTERAREGFAVLAFAVTWVITGLLGLALFGRMPWWELVWVLALCWVWWWLVFAVALNVLSSFDGGSASTGRGRGSSGEPDFSPPL